MKIIGFAGKAGVGKDTAGSFLQEKGYKPYAFAHPLKYTVSKMLDLPIVALESRELKEHKLSKTVKLSEEDAQNFMSHLPITITDHNTANKIISKFEGKEINTIRELLQFLGTEIVRSILGQDAWVKVAKKAIEELPKGTNVVITDVRFENERDLVQALGGKVYTIIRGVSEINTDTHTSELINFKTDGIINNNSSIEKLNKKLEELLNAN